MFILAVAFVPTALIGIMSYFIATKYIEKEVTQTHQVQLKRAQEKMDDQLSGIELNLTQWSLNPLVGESLRSLDVVDDYLRINELYRWLHTLEVTSPLIEKVSIYVEGPSVVINSDLTVRLNDRQEAYFRSFLDRKQAMFWQAPSKDAEQYPGSDHLILVHTLSGSSVQSFGAMLVYMDPQQVDKLVSDLTVDARGTSLMYISEEGPIFGSAEGQAEYKLQEALYAETANRTEPNGAFIWKSNGDTYTVSYGTINRLGRPWTYVSATTMSNLTAPVMFISRLMIGVSITVLLLTLLVSWFASNRIYRPIRKIVELVTSHKAAEEQDLERDEVEWIEKRWLQVNRESERYQTRLMQALPALKESFLLQLTQGHLQSVREDEILEQMKQFGWQSDQAAYSILFIHLFGLARLREGFSEKDKQLITFASANITEEITRKQFDSIGVVNFRNLSVGLLIMVPKERDHNELKRDLHLLAHELITHLSKLLKMNITVSIGRTVSSVKEIAASMDEARHALRYRDIEQNNQVIDVVETMSYGKEGMFYPFELEKQFLQAIRTGNKEEAVRTMKEFVKAVQKESGKEGTIHLSMLQLLGSLLQVVIQTGYNPAKLYNGANLYDDLLKVREPEEMMNWFETVAITPYLNELNEAQDSYLKKLVASAAELIHRQYKYDISLEACAEMLGTNSVKLSSGFKQVMGINFIDYLTRVRIDKVKQLLIHTDMKIHDIALEVGYQPTYFNRIFKKQEGVTATQFRMSHRK